MLLAYYNISTLTVVDYTVKLRLNAFRLTKIKNVNVDWL